MLKETKRRLSHREKYLRHVQNLGPVAIVTESFDRSVVRARSKPHVIDMTDEEVHDLLRPTIEEAQEVIASVDPFTDHTSWNDLYRLIGRVSFAAELVRVPRAFVTDDYENRARIANGTSGIATDIVEQALSNFYDPRTTQKQHTELRGVVNEYTPIALINYPQDGRGIALPGSLRADNVAKTDSFYYGTDNEGRHYRMGLQFKSKRRPLTDEEKENTQIYENVAYIHANDFGNIHAEDGFSVSNILVSEYHGRPLTEKQEQRLAKAQSTIMRLIFTQRNANNTLYSK